MPETIEAQFQEPTPDGLVWTAAASKESAAASAAFLNTNYRIRSLSGWQEYPASY